MQSNRRNKKSQTIGRFHPLPPLNSGKAALASSSSYSSANQSSGFPKCSRTLGQYGLSLGQCINLLNWSMESAKGLMYL